MECLILYMITFWSESRPVYLHWLRSNTQQQRNSHLIPYVWSWPSESSSLVKLHQFRLSACIINNLRPLVGQHLRERVDSTSKHDFSEHQAYGCLEMYPTAYSLLLLLSLLLIRIISYALLHSFIPFLLLLHASIDINIRLNQNNISALSSISYPTQDNPAKITRSAVESVALLLFFLFISFQNAERELPEIIRRNWPSVRRDPDISRQKGSGSLSRSFSYLPMIRWPGLVTKLTAPRLYYQSPTALPYQSDMLCASWDVGARCGVAKTLAKTQGL